MADDTGGVRERLQILYLRAKTDETAKATAMAALGAELDRLLFKAEDPSQDARAFLVYMMFDAAKDDKTGARAGMVDAMAFSGPEKEHPENKRAAGIVHVTQSSEIQDIAKRKNALKEDAKDARLHPFARNLAGLLLVKQWREELRQKTDAEFYREAKAFMDDEAYLRGTRVEVANFLLDYCINAGKAFPVVGEIATSGNWPDLAEKAGRWLVDHYIETDHVGMAKRVADAPNTPQSVKDYAAKRFEEIGFRPLDTRMEKKTMTGMPVVRVADYRERLKQLRGVPPSPEHITGRKETLRGPPK